MMESGYTFTRADVVENDIRCKAMILVLETIKPVPVDILAGELVSERIAEQLADGLESDYLPFDSPSVPVFTDHRLPRGMAVMRGADGSVAILDLRTPDETQQDVETYGRTENAVD